MKIYCKSLECLTTVRNIPYNAGKSRVRAMQNQDLLELEAVAEILHVTVDTVRAYIREKQLPAYKVGRSYLVDRADVYKFLRDRRTDRKDDDKA
jgi:excisionase family DNA binding protein